MIGVREPVRLRAGIGEHRSLFQRQDRVDGTGCAEERLDRIPALRVRERVPWSLGNGEVDSRVGCCNAQELRTVN